MIVGDSCVLPPGQVLTFQHKVDITRENVLCIELHVIFVEGPFTTIKQKHEYPG
jgi:hypothetical protein